MLRLLAVNVMHHLNKPIIMMELTDKENFSKEFIERYSKAGFGSMNKNDFEVMIYDLLRRYGNLKDKTNYQASILLQIPESKIKRLAYEADLKYGNYQQDDIKKNFFEIIAKSKFHPDKNKIQFVIENKFLRNSISAKLKELGHFSDSSFNSEIISIHIEAFIDLLESYYPEESINKIINECKKTIKAEKGEEITFKLIMRKFIERLAKQAGQQIINIGLSYFTGGAENITGLIKSIKKIISGA
jgi:hypothetical protein